MTGRRFHVMFLAAFAAAGVFSPSVAQAANTSCANADFLFLGERAQYTIPSTTSLFFKARVTANRSYSVLAWGPTQDVGEGGVNLSVTLYSDSSCTTGAAGVDSTDYEPLVSLVPGHMGDSDSLIPPADGVVYIQVANNIGAPYTMHVLIIETTLFSPWWFTGGDEPGVRRNSQQHERHDGRAAHGLRTHRSRVWYDHAEYSRERQHGSRDQFPWVVCLYRVGFGANRVPRHACGAGSQYHDDRRRKRHVIRLAIHATDGLVDVQPLTR